MNVLTIQDISCFGSCSTTVALPILSALGHETAILPGCMLSTHTAGFKDWVFQDLTNLIDPISEHWKKEGIKFDAFYTGYVTESQIPPILRAIERTKKPSSIKIVDPAMADGGHLYPGFAPDFPSKMAELVRGSDYILPNITEACLLAGVPYLGDNKSGSDYTKADIESLIDKLEALDVGCVVLTGVSTKKGSIGAAVREKGNRTQYYQTEWLDVAMHGTGDAYAAAFVGKLLSGSTPLEAASIAADFVLDSIKHTLPIAKEHWWSVSYEPCLKALVNR